MLIEKEKVRTKHPTVLVDYDGMHAIMIRIP